MFCIKLIHSDSTEEKALLHKKKIQNQFENLIQMDPMLYRAIKQNLLYESDVNLLLVELSMITAENKRSIRELYEYGIHPLVDAHPDLIKIQNLKHFKLIVDFLIIAYKKNVVGKELYMRLYTVLNSLLLNKENFEQLELILNFVSETEPDKFNILLALISASINVNPYFLRKNNFQKLQKHLDQIYKIVSITDSKDKSKIITLLFSHMKWELDQIESWFQLFFKIMNTYSHSAYPILESLLVAVEHKIVPENLTLEDELRILTFISQINLFEPMFYKAYEIHGQKFINELKKLGQNILADQFQERDIEELSAYIESDKDESILALAQTKIPPSGASFVSKKETLALYKKMAAIGDLRQHVPLYWQNKEILKEIEVSEMKVIDGEMIDKEGKVKKIIDLLRDENRPSKNEVLRELTRYLAKGQNDQDSLDELKNKLKFLEVFLRYAGRKDLLGEKTDRLGEKDYYSLRLLEEIFKDKDNLPTLLKDLLAEVEYANPQLLKIKSKYQKISNADYLLKHINKNLPKLQSEENKVKALSKMLMKYDPKEIKNILIPRIKEKDLLILINTAIGQENVSFMAQNKIIDKLLADRIAAIKHELQKFESVSKEESLKLGFRVVKGLPYSLWGLNAGVCIARDVELWKNPSFKLISIIDKKNGIVGGFIHVFETEVGGKKILTIPGIEPSVEFLNNVDPSALYDQIENVLRELAKLGGYDAVYIPISANIHSNRTGIKKAIQKKKYQVIKLSKAVNWNNLLKPYPFIEVYVIPILK